MGQEITLNLEDFNKFVRVLSLLNTMCDCADIQDSYIRQKSNKINSKGNKDRNIIIEIALKDIFKTNVSVPINNLTETLAVFKCFSGSTDINKAESNQPYKIIIKIEKNEFSISDNLTTIKFSNTFVSQNFYIDNNEDKLKSESEMSHKVHQISDFLSLEPNNLLLDVTIKEIMSNRMKIAKSFFGKDEINIILKGNYANIFAVSPGKDKSAQFLSNIKTNKEINASTEVLINPFILDHDDDINYQIYQHPKDNNIFLNVFNTYIAGLELKVYTFSGKIK